MQYKQKNGLRQHRDAKLLAVVVGSPHAEQVMINKRLGFESNLAEKVGDFGIALRMQLITVHADTHQQILRGSRQLLFTQTNTQHEPVSLLLHIYLASLNSKTPS